MFFNIISKMERLFFILSSLINNKEKLETINEFIKTSLSDDDLNQDNINSIKLFIENINTNNFSEKNNPFKNSYLLGKNSETEIYERLVNDFPNLFINIISKISHMCDIHVEDPENKIIYLIELKNKISINKEDIDKFELDLKNYKSNLNKIGIFISLNSSAIPGKIRKGDLFCIEGDKIYMIGYDNKILNLIFSSLYKFIIPLNDVKPSISEENYKIYNSILKNIKSKKIHLDILNDNIKNLKKVINNQQSIITDISLELKLYESFEVFIKTQLGEKTIENEINENEKNNLSEYITKKGFKTKKELIEKFPTISSFINEKTIEELKKL